MQLICFSPKECNPLLNDVRIYTSVFTFGPPSQQTDELDSQKKKKMLLRFLTCFSPVHICEADLSFIDSHFVNFHAFFCSLRANPPTLALDLLKISHL